MWLDVVGVFGKRYLELLQVQIIIQFSYFTLTCKFNQDLILYGGCILIPCGVSAIHCLILAISAYSDSPLLPSISQLYTVALRPFTSSYSWCNFSTAFNSLRCRWLAEQAGLRSAQHKIEFPSRVNRNTIKSVSMYVYNPIE